MHVYTGALKKAAENARKDGKSVGCSIVETFGKDATPQELSDVLRLEYRSKLLNPRWAKVNARETNKFAFPPICLPSRHMPAFGPAASTGYIRAAEQDKDFDEQHAYEQEEEIDIKNKNEKSKKRLKRIAGIRI